MDLPVAERRLGNVEDVSKIAAFLASDGAKWITADSIDCSGGSLHF